jgi:hypothetical protein
MRYEQNIRDVITNDLKVQTTDTAEQRQKKIAANKEKIDHVLLYFRKLETVHIWSGHC